MKQLTEKAWAVWSNRQPRLYEQPGLPARHIQQQAKYAPGLRTWHHKRACVMYLSVGGWRQEYVYAENYKSAAGAQQLSFSFSHLKRSSNVYVSQWIQDFSTDENSGRFWHYFALQGEIKTVVSWERGSWTIKIWNIEHCHRLHIAYAVWLVIITCLHLLKPFL